MSHPDPDLDRSRRSELLARADRDRLVELADELIDRLGPPTVDGPPETGLVMMQVREPVCGDRFHLGEIVVSQSRVVWRGASGWGMRLGTDREATLAAALCDAAAQADADADAAVATLCRETATAEADRAGREWHDLLATEVVFEELD